MREILVEEIIDNVLNDEAFLYENKIDCNIITDDNIVVDDIDLYTKDIIKYLLSKGYIRFYEKYKILFDIEDEDYIFKSEPNDL